MHIEECNTHSYNHRNCHETHKKTRDKKERATELAENRNHQGHIAAESEFTRIRLYQSIEIDQLIQSMNKKQYEHSHYRSQYA